MESKYIGIIGMGEMGALYAKHLSMAGWRVNVCDTAEKVDELQATFGQNTNIRVFENGHLVSRASDWIIYSVPAEIIDRVVALYGPSTKQGAIVGGQTSCKAPEISAFENYLPADVDIITCHSLHGPKVSPVGQPLAIISHRVFNQDSIKFVETVLSCLRSRTVHISATEHDIITADTQAVTHAAFLSMGTAWQANNQFPWETSRYIGGIENIKINITLRIYSSKWHVYAGLAILNPSAQKQIRQYAQSVTELFKLMLGGHREELEHRVKTAGKAVFKDAQKRHLLLEDAVLDRFSLGNGLVEKTPNNHLSLLAMVDCWWKLGIVPYDHMICSTPLFRLLLGTVEYVFRNPDILDDVLKTAIYDSTFRSDDLEFTFAARGWSDCVSFGNFASYRDRFEKISKYFAPRFPEATKIGNEMMATILAKTLDDTHNG